MGGERVAATVIGERGLLGDRLWAVRDEERGVLTDARRYPALLLCSARFVHEPAPDVGPGHIPDVTLTLPDGSTIRSDDPDVHARLSAVLGHRVTLQALRPASDRAHYAGIAAATLAAHARSPEAAESATCGEGSPSDGSPSEGSPSDGPDLSRLPMAKLLELGVYVTPPGTYFDVMALHVLTTASLDALRARTTSDFDVRRFRPNVLVETTGTGLVETGWTGGTLALGACTALVDCPTVRCSMPTHAQPGLDADPKVLKTIVQEADTCLGVYAAVTRGGEVRVGDAVQFAPPPPPREAPH